MRVAVARMWDSAGHDVQVSYPVQPDQRDSHADLYSVVAGAYFSVVGEDAPMAAWTRTVTRFEEVVLPAEDGI